ncbi:MAG: kynureninase [Lewinellaceae bacterium]|nr:kynureninase [Lewinellaceae bacterium]HRW75071.1 kynureninase [Saprospiraceae bacterium]
MMTFQATLDFARSLDRQDPLAGFRDRFHIPPAQDGSPSVYFCGNSLGLQPKSTREYVLAELDDWARLGVEGHTHARHPWMPYHEFLTEKMARVVGAKPREVVVMNSLTVNLHLMMVSFYRPTTKRRKIVLEYSPFPSDRYAVASQLRYHGFDPVEDLIELQPRQGSDQVLYEDLETLLEEEGHQIALLLIGGVNYYTGQAYDLRRITALGHRYGCMVGFDLAHAAGNLPLQLHDDGPDFAAWCSYKYLNSGPGSLSGVFVHERHANHPAMPRFEGWWGQDKDTRFLMPDTFTPIQGAEGWQLSNPPILPMAAMRASLDLFDEAGMDRLTAKSRQLTGFLEYLLQQQSNPRFSLITPSDPDQRGCQLSIRVAGADKSVFHRLSEQGVIADWREPDVIRVAPVPLYNSFEDVFHFVERLSLAVS